jgi:hypothetical protein
MTVGSRLFADGAGRDLVAADVAVGAGWGDDAPVVTIRAGSNDSRGAIDVLSDGSNQAQATATVTVTFTKAYDAAPIVVVGGDIADLGAAGAATHGWNVGAVSTTAFTVTLDTIPVDAKDYGFSYVVVG